MEPATQTNEPYPVEFSVEYPDRDLDRLSTAFRILWVIPIAIVIAVISARPGIHVGTSCGRRGRRALPADAPADRLPAEVPAVVVRLEPRVSRFSNRVGVYLALMDDRYPSTDEHQGRTLDFPYPDARNGLNRWLPLVKWFLAIPHYIVLVFLGIATVFVVIFAWFAILFTGRYPRGSFEFVEGVLRWENRVAAYAFVLVTDKYPPFQLSP